MRPTVSRHVLLSVFALITTLFLSVPQSQATPNLLKDQAAENQAAPQQAPQEQSGGQVSTWRGPRKAYVWSGWENDIVQGAPNLKNYYWNPQTRYMQNNGSKRTGRQSSPAATPLRRSHYMKPIRAQMPVNPAAGPYTLVEGKLSSADVSAKLRRRNLQGDRAALADSTSEEVTGVLTYGNSYSSNTGMGAGSMSRSSKLSVRGELYRTR